MRKAYMIMAVGLLAFASISEAGRFDIVTLDVTTGTNATALVTDSNTKVKGLIREIWVDTSTAGATGTVTVVATPADTTFAAVTLVASTNVTTQLTYRPRFDNTDTSGAALTGDPPEPFLSIANTITLSVTNASATNATFKVLIKVEKD